MPDALPAAKLPIYPGFGEAPNTRKLGLRLLILNPSKSFY